MIYKKLFFIAVTISFAVSGHCQVNPDLDLKVKKKDFKTGDEEGFKEAWKNLKKANKYFYAGIGTFKKARDHYMLAGEYNNEHPVVNFLTGICFLHTDNKYQALDFLKKAYEKSPDLHPELELYLAEAYHFVLEFDNAIKHYRNYRQERVSSKDVDAARMIDKRIDECNYGKELIKNPVRAIIANPGDNINSAWDDYLPVLAYNDSAMYITSRRPVGEKDKRNPYDNKFYENIYVARLSENSTWKEVIPVSSTINSKENDACLGVSPDGEVLYIYNGAQNEGDVLVSVYSPKKSDWKKPRPLSGKLNSNSAEGSVFLTVTGDTMYFISGNEKLSEGGKDILYTVKDEKGNWTKPLNLGGYINSPFDEEGIYVTPDGKTLYFGSKGHNSMGGFDIFVSRRLDNGSWGEPENMGYPVNTPEDEVFFTMTNSGKTAYYTTIRDGGKGERDIYKITFLGSEKELLLSKGDAMDGILPETRKRGFFKPVVEIESEFTLQGNILDKQNGAPLKGKIEFIDSETSMVVATTISSKEGKYSVKLPDNKVYEVEVLVQDYMIHLNVADMTDAITDKPTIQNYELDRIQVGTKLVLENIYFETGKAVLKPESYPQLKQLVDLLENNKSVRLEISGHTDNTGSVQFNNKLSEKRAKAVVDYLVSRGIVKERLEWAGYGLTQPISTNSTSEGRAQNRRVELKILAK